MTHKLLALLLALGLAASARTDAADRLFEVKPPDKIAFNYPDPPRVGQADYFTVAEDGKARCAILYAARPLYGSAELLKAYLDLATGADIPLVSARRGRVPEGLGVIHVGPTPQALKLPLGLPDLRYGGSRIKNVHGFLVATPDEKTLIVRGEGHRATAFGVVGLLKRFVGVRHFWHGKPGGIGDVVPKRATLRLPKIEWRDWPYFPSRTMSGVNRFGPPDTSRKRPLAVRDFFQLQPTIPCGESYYLWLAPQKYGKTHPEYYPLHHGKRYVPKPRKQGWQPCVSNPDVAHVMADGITEHFDKHPNAIAVNLSVNDGAGDCMCAACRAMDSPNADYTLRTGISDRYVKFSNAVAERVAKKHPDKLLSFIAYGSMREPPRSVKLHRNLLPVLCLTGSAGNTYQYWDDWMRTGAKHMGVYLYHFDQNYLILPKLDMRQSAKRLRYLVASGRARVFYDGFYPFWPLEGIVAYLQAELTWDPRRDVDALLAEYWQFFGPAADPMKGFYETLETGYQRWLEATAPPHPYGKDFTCLWGGRSFSQFEVLNPAEADRAEAFLRKAVAAAAKDPMASRRVDIVRKLFEFAALGARQHWIMKRLGSEPVDSAAEAEQYVRDAARLLELGKAQGRYKQEVMEKPPITYYAPFSKYPGRKRGSGNVLYQEITPENGHPLTLTMASKGLEAVNAYLAKAMSREQAAAWWRERLASAKDPRMAEAMRAAMLRVAGPPMKNLARDPGFEKVGAGIARDKPDMSPSARVWKKYRLNLWYRGGTPFNWDVATKEVHGGKYALSMTGSVKGVLQKWAKPFPGARYRFEVWLKHNDARGVYRVGVLGRTKKGRLPLVQINVPKKPGEWQKLSLDWTAPPNTRSISFMIFALSQARGATLWIDDVFVGRYGGDVTAP